MFQKLFCQVHTVQSMSSQMLCSKEPLSTPWLGAGMFPGHEDAVRLSPTAGIAHSYQRVSYRGLHSVIAKYLIEYDENRGHDTLQS